MGVSTTPSLGLINFLEQLTELRHCPTLANPWTIACQAPLSMGFSRQEYWSGLPFLSLGDLPDPGIEPGQADDWIESLESIELIQLNHCRQMIYQLSYEGSPKAGLSGVGFEPTPPGETAIWMQHLRLLVHLESKSSPGVIRVGKTCLASHMHTITWWYSRHKGRIKATLEVGKPSSACEF